MDERDCDGPLLRTEAQTAQHLGIPQTWIAAERRKGNIPHHVFGRWIRYSQADVDAILKRHEVQAAGDPGGLTAGSRRYHDRRAR